MPAARPTPDGREWLQPTEIARWIVKALRRQYSTIESLSELNVRRAVRLAYEETGYQTEFKILRLTERIYDNLKAGVYQNLDEIRQDFDAAYTRAVLDCFDENGNVLPECE